jgi:hypothetical protein
MSEGRRRIMMQALISSKMPNAMPRRSRLFLGHSLKRAMNHAPVAGLIALLVVVLAAPVLAESAAVPEVVEDFR